MYEEKKESKYRYNTVNLPKTLTDKINDVIVSKKHGYINVPDFVKASIRIYLRELVYIK